MFTGEQGDTLFPVETSANVSGAFVRASSRRDDPETSRKAAEKIRPHASGHAEKILAVMRGRPPMTAVEIAARCDGLDRYQVSRRLPQMERAKLVERRAARECSVREGSEMLTWAAVES
jgi:hypothetical protein